MANAITRPRLKDVVKESVADAILKVPKDRDISAGEALRTAETVARDVVDDGRIAPALRPVRRIASQTLQGIAAAGASQLLEATGLVKSLVIAAGWFGAAWNAEDVSTVLSTVLTFAALGWAWYGRETTTRPIG